MKKLLIIASLASFSSFAGSHYQIAGGSCWKCVGGTFKSGQIECSPERTARLFEVDMNECMNQAPSRAANLNNSFPNYYGQSNQAAPVVKTYKDLERERIQAQINELQRQLNSL